MDDGLILLVIAIAIVLQGLFLYVIIQWAMRIKRQLWNQKHLLNFLIEIAKKLDATGNFDIEKMKLMNNTISDQYLK
jgi:hypothetical protein